MIDLINKLRTSFSSKLVFLLAVFCILIVLCFGGARYFIVYTKADKLQRTAAENKLNSAWLICSEYTETFGNIVNSVASDSGSVLWMNKPEMSDSSVIMLCRSLSDSFSYISSVWVIRENGGEYAASDGSTGKLKLGSLNWYPSMYINSSQQQVFIQSSGLVSEEECAVMISAVMDGERVIGYAGAEMPLSAVKELFAKYHLDSDPSVVVTSPDDTVIYSSDPKYPEQTLYSDSEKLCTVTGYEYKSRWKITVTVNRSVLSKAVMSDLRTEIVTLAALLVVMILAINSVVRRECRQIPRISRSIAEISAGNYNFRINDRSENEIGIIARSADDLAQALQDKSAVIDEYANTDLLTGAKNRVKMYEAVEDLIVSRDSDRPKFALVFIDIDNFRWINDTLGHRYGDIVLKEFADRLALVFGKVYRFSSDIFTVLIDLEGGDVSVVERRVEQLNNLMKEPVSVITSSLYLHCSEGAAVYPTDGETADGLLKCADIALKRSKDKGKNRLSYYSRSRHNKITDKTAIAQLLTCALEKNELYLNYQPIVSTADRSLHGFEVLLRWESDELGFVPPSRFVEVAEETGEIVKIGTWILESSFRFLKQINEYDENVILSINVSAVQLRQHDFMEGVRRVLDITKVNPKNVQIEITETSLVSFSDHSLQFINEMSELGFGIALDDFGTGYSSLNYLKSFPITCLKVDKSFVDDIASGGNDYQITDSIIDMVHNMNIKTVAEGVETLAQYNSIIALKCDYIQGFLMSKPMDESSALEFVRMYDIMYKPDNKQLEETEKKLRDERRSPSAVKSPPNL